MYIRSIFLRIPIKILLNLLKIVRGEPKVVYTNIPYIYYFLTEKINSFEANIQENGTDTYWKYVFELPEDWDMNEIYILRETSEKHINELEAAGVETYYESGMFRCYYLK